MPSISELLTEDIYRPFFEDDLEVPVDPTYADRLRALVGCDLPDDYLEFLRSYPYAGLCYDYRIDDSMCVSGLESHTGAPDSIYPINVIRAQSKHRNCDLIRSNQEYYAPGRLLLIADTSGTQLFGMSLEEGSFGHIYYYDWSYFEGQVSLIAKSFTDFVMRLAPHS